MDEYMGFCVPCKTERVYEGRVEVQPSGRRVAVGECPVCSADIKRVLGGSQ